MLSSTDTASVAGTVFVGPLLQETESGILRIVSSTIVRCTDGLLTLLLTLLNAPLYSVYCYDICVSITQIESLYHFDLLGVAFKVNNYWWSIPALCLSPTQCLATKSKEGSAQQTEELQSPYLGLLFS